MDQLKENLEKVKPYAFWIVCTVILLMSLGTWYMATGTLHQQKEENTGKIKSADQTLTSLGGKAADHPNPESTKGMDKLINAYGREIAAGWDAQYERQKGVLVWPKSFDEDFQLAVKDLRPIEKVPVATPINLAIRDGLRRRYRDFIEDELPKLAETIGARWHARRDGTEETTPNQLVGPDGRPVEDLDNSLVLWNQENQREILQSHYGFTAMANDPSTLDVLYAQEDLWVLQNLMEIIKKANDTAQARHDAVVKKIEFIRIGKSALGNAGQVMYIGTGTTPGAGGGEGGYPQAPQPEGSPQPEGTPPATPVAPAPGAPAVIVPPPSPTADPNFNPRDPANWRYVDRNNFPLAGFQLRTALTAPTPENALLTVAKRMPVRIRLEINQRQLNKLLAEFGNAALPVEIRQIRINREPAAVGSLEGFFTPGGGVGPSAGPVPGGGGFRGGGEGSGFAAGPGPSRGYPGGGEGGFGGFQPSGGGSGSLTRDATVDTNLIQLELYGIVYLYNPVNHALLGLAPTGGTAAIATPPVIPSGG